MDFSSLPVNQFDSHNWQQQGNQQQLDRVTTDQNPNFNLPQLSSPPANSQAGSSQPRVNSMVERARIAKVPLPEAALKCPRCDSTNTKFCYFNNYNLTQPRHFCKTCRRYWTRGGALRNVPVGGGFRRNKRSKSNGGRSKSTVVVSADNNTTTTSTTSLTSHPSYSNPSKFLSYGQIPGFTSNLTTMSPLQSLGDYNSSNIGLDFGGIQISNAISGMSSNSGILDPWRITSLQQAQQFPFLMNNNTGLEQSSSALYPLLQGNEGVNQANTQQESSNYSNHLRSKPLMDMASSRNAAQPINVKAEEKDQDQDRDGNGVNNLSRNLLENINMNSAGNNEYTTWGGSGNLNTSWTGFTTSNNSTGHLSF